LYLLRHGTLAKSLPAEPLTNKSGIESAGVSQFTLEGDLADITRSFGKGTSAPVFGTCGIIIGRNVTTLNVTPSKKILGKLGNVLLKHQNVDERYFVPASQLQAWKYLKGAKKELRTHAGSGAQYHYAEGSMAFPDLPENPSRTILTGEGGSSPSRFKHIVKTDDGRYRRLTPVELERLNGFPDDWTRYTAQGELTDAKRAFFMGNALVVDIVELIGRQLAREFVACRRR